MIFFAHADAHSTAYSTGQITAALLIYIRTAGEAAWDNVCYQNNTVYSQDTFDKILKNKTINNNCDYACEVSYSYHIICDVCAWEVENRYI